jgi:hypothetical protein
MLRKNLSKKVMTVIQLMENIPMDKQVLLKDRFCHGKSLRAVAEERGQSFCYIRELEEKLILQIERDLKK